MSCVLHKALEHAGGEDEYYFWMKEIAKLNRFELKEFKERWAKAMSQALRCMACPPYFLISTRTKCGFVFLPVILADTYRAEKNLISVVTAEKYRHKLDKCIGFSFLAAEDGFYDNHIMCDESKWVPNQDLERLVQDGEDRGLLRKALCQAVPSYQL